MIQFEAKMYSYHSLHSQNFVVRNLSLELIRALQMMSLRQLNSVSIRAHLFHSDFKQ